MADQPAQPNQSLIDGLQVLRALAVAGEPVGSRQMARDLGLEPTRVNRLLKTLATLGVARQTHDRKYVSGPAMHVLSVQAMYGSGLLRRARTVLEPLRNKGYDVALGVLWQDRVCYLYHAQSRDPAGDPLSVQGLYPAEHSGIGLPLLAELGDADVRRLYENRPPEGGIGKLIARLHGVRAAGYAWVQAGGARQADAVGVSVGKPAFAGLAMAGRITSKELEQVIGHLQGAAEELGVEAS